LQNLNLIIKIFIKIKNKKNKKNKKQKKKKRQKKKKKKKKRWLATLLLAKGVAGATSLADMGYYPQRP
jgi:hypothetical protein